VVGFSFRGSHGVLASQASYYSLDARRLLELVVPFPFGYPGHYGPSGLDAWGALDHLPYFFSIYPGLVALVIGALAWHSQRVLAGLAASGLMLAWVLGLSGEALVSLGGGLFRSPEKLLFWPALALPILSGLGLERVRQGAGQRAPLALLAAAVAAAAGAAVVALAGWTPTALLVPGPAPPDAAIAVAQREVWLGALAIAALLLAGTALAVRLRSADTAIALQLAALLQLAPLWMTDQVEPYRAQPFGVVVAGDGVVNARMAYPPWQIDRDRPVFPPGPHFPNERFQAMELAPAPGVLEGLSYPLAPDLEGLHHLFTSFLTIQIRDVPWSERARWLEVVGADLLVSPEPLEVPALELAAIHKAYGVRSFFFRTLSPAPEAWWPESLVVASSPLDAFERVARSPAGSLPGIVPQSIELADGGSGVQGHRPGGKVEVLAMESDRVELEVESEGGLVVVRRAFQPLLRARIAGREIPTLPANLCLLGVVVPAGRHRVEIGVSSLPEIVAAVVAGTVAAALGLVLLVGRSRHRGGSGGTGRASS
jgi:hypothetical protein